MDDTRKENMTIYIRRDNEGSSLTLKTWKQIDREGSYLNLKEDRSKIEVVWKAVEGFSVSERKGKIAGQLVDNFKRDMLKNVLSSWRKVVEL